MSKPDDSHGDPWEQLYTGESAVTVATGNCVKWIIPSAFDETVKMSTTVDERSLRWDLRTAVHPIAARTAVVDLEAPAERGAIDGTALRRVVDRLSMQFAGVFSHEAIARLVDESLGEWGDARITVHLPTLVERFTKERLRAVAHMEGRLVKDVPEVLFVCEHNAGRSQMAAALLDHFAEGRVHVRSAGSTPASEINPAVARAMDEIGIDISKEFPKPLTDEVVRDADAVITMGCGDACPIYPGTRYLDWDLPDPAGKSIEQIRPIRDEIDRRVRTLLAELVPAAS